jgi:hypothetical protein
MVSWHVDKFHDFLTLFVFYTIFKQLIGKFTTMFSEHVARISDPLLKSVVTCAK